MPPYSKNPNIKALMELIFLAFEDTSRVLLELLLGDHRRYQPRSLQRSSRDLGTPTGFCRPYRVASKDLNNPFSPTDSGTHASATVLLPIFWMGNIVRVNWGA